VACCLSLNTKLQKINARVNRQKRLTKGKSCTDTLTPKTFILASTSAFFKSTLFVSRVSASLKLTCQAILSLTFLSVICYNCKKLGYFFYDCLELKHANLKKIKENKDKKTLKSEKEYA
jgi:hypothetical protein